jgi:membrane-bound ClpP family serine protease
VSLQFINLILINEEDEMVKVIGLFVMFISFYGLQNGGFDLGLAQAFSVGLFMFFSEALFAHFFFVQREKVRAKYRRR